MFTALDCQHKMKLADQNKSIAHQESQAFSACPVKTSLRPSWPLVFLSSLQIALVRL